LNQNRLICTTSLMILLKYFSFSTESFVPVRFQSRSFGSNLTGEPFWSAQAMLAPEIMTQ